jgi:hypothetical protein
MALTALHPTLGVLDATAANRGSWWPNVHRTGATLSCRACATPVSAVHDPANPHRPYFSRHRAATGCWLSESETEEHVSLKVLLARLIRSVLAWSAVRQRLASGRARDRARRAPDRVRSAAAAASTRSIKDRSEAYAARASKCAG